MGVDRAQADVEPIGNWACFEPSCQHHHEFEFLRCQKSQFCGDSIFEYADGHFRRVEGPHPGSIMLSKQDGDLDFLTHASWICRADNTLTFSCGSDPGRPVSHENQLPVP